MSYRIYVHTAENEGEHQCLGNNECPKVLIDELKNQGCEFDEDYCFENFEIKDLQGIIEALEKYILETNDRFKGKIGDFRDYFGKKEFRRNLTLRISFLVECGYMFVTYNFLKYIGEENYETDWDYEKGREIYKIAEGKHIYMSGF